MKRSLILASLLLVGTTSVMADTYVGIEYGANSNTNKITGPNTDYSGTNKNNDFSIKLGTGTDGDWKGQIRLSSISYDESLFDNTHTRLIEFGVDAIKEFTVGVNNLYPYVKVGFGVGSMNVDGYDKSSIAEVSFNAGAGVSYKAVEHLYIIAGVDYVGRKWQDITDGYGDTYSVTDSGVKPYIGVNYAF